MVAPDLSRDNIPELPQDVQAEQLPPQTEIPEEQPLPQAEQSIEQPLPAAPEQGAEFERVPETQEKDESGKMDSAIDTLIKKLRKPKKRKPTKIPQVRDELTVEVEKLLEEGLEDAYKEMTPIQQQEFKIKGEKTALEIRSLLKGTHVKIKKIFLLIIEWLKIIPGLNRFFLEQEAKIKADKIIALKNRFFNKNN
jgi:hypothetical protein